MTESKTKKGAGKTKHVGSRKVQIDRYYNLRYAKNKLRRILDSQGMSEAQSWADKHLCTGVLGEILRRRQH